MLEEAGFFSVSSSAGGVSGSVVGSVAGSVVGSSVAPPSVAYKLKNALVYSSESSILSPKLSNISSRPSAIFFWISATISPKCYTSSLYNSLNSPKVLFSKLLRSCVMAQEKKPTSKMQYVLLIYI